MKKVDLSRVDCPIARSLDVIGEWWTLVIVRDALRGATRFEDFRQAGISDNILSARLRRLTEEGIFDRRLYQDHPERFEYHLTDKGRDLMTVIGAIALWGIKWTDGPQVNRMLHSECGHGLSLQPYCEHCGRPVDRSEVRVPTMLHPERAAI